jgi:hypothetical protein
MTDRLELPETGQVFHHGRAIAAANIWERAPVADPAGAVKLRAQVVVGEGFGADVAEGDEVEIGAERWRVEAIVEDPVSRRGRVTLARVA